MQPLASIPSPSQGVWHLGPIPLRAYAIMIILGIVVAVWLGERRWAAKGGTPGMIIDIAIWAVPFGLIGGRLYHVATDWQRYFGEGQDPIRALKIWEGGLGIWGAVLLGAVGAWIGCRRHGVSLAALGDAIAPGIALAQAIGRWGNYWNQELYGRPLNAPWALEIDRAHRPSDPKYLDIATYHPTFLYESLWCVGVALLVLWADRRFKLTHGRAFALYVAAYTVGRFWIEWLRIDDAHHFLGMRLNDWTALVVFVGAVAYLFWARNRTGEETVVAPAAAHAVDAAEKPATDPTPDTEQQDTPAPGTPTSAPDNADSDPAEPPTEPKSAPTDTEDQPEPTHEAFTTKPTVVQAEPAADETFTAEPTVDQAEPVSDQAELIGEQAEPAAGEADPVAEQVEPVDEAFTTEPEATQAEPTMDQADPIDEQPEPATDETAPVAEQIEPAHEAFTVEPEATQAEPTVVQAEPVDEQAEPVVEQVEPATSEVDPVAEQAEPAHEASTAEPETGQAESETGRSEAAEQGESAREDASEMSVNGADRAVDEPGDASGGEGPDKVDAGPAKDAK
ncbi:prolipoprotein diacylglyceryl transferase [Actinomadura kijaniata]|uniref:Phosphatidylglycerol--prolipoprotein diacylglyceryl transferase n=1 Tax=Actinomadura namibiensis TaxID=182080 RepID=A0A7W3QP68_ACTNM|nr:prolipoprotein diacylglyceryl transferase [Actinomadura namibiensis]